MATQASSNLVVVDGMPSVEKLWNGRFRLEFFCTPSNKNEGWYGDNIAKWLPEFGTLQGADFTGEGWEALDGEVYPDMCLVEAEAPYIPPSESHLVKLVYETLTTSWVQEKDDNIDYEANGLRRVSRQSVALPNTTYSSVVGATSMDSSGTTVWLASSKIDETDAKWTLTEVWMEAGLLSTSFSTDADGLTSNSQTWLKTVGTTPALPDGAITGRKIGEYQGLQTITIEKKGFPTSGSYTYNSTAQFTIPGTVTVSYRGITVGSNLTIVTTPPVTTPVKSTVTVTYSTTSSVDISSLYQPTEWASSVASGLGWGGATISSVNTFTNHIRIGSGGGLTGPVIGGVNACLGTRIYGGATASITLYGPTDDPAGTTQTIGITNEPTFKDEDGVQYYKKTVTKVKVPNRP
jgi:hypothetical protein